MSNIHCPLVPSFLLFKVDFYYACIVFFKVITIINQNLLLAALDIYDFVFGFPHTVPLINEQDITFLDALASLAFKLRVIH